MLTVDARRSIDVVVGRVGSKLNVAKVSLAPKKV